MKFNRLQKFTEITQHVCGTLSVHQKTQTVVEIGRKRHACKTQERP